MRAKKVDQNHAAIRDHLRDCGWSVFDTAALGKGFGDLVVARLRHTCVLEAKVGKSEPNELQRDFRNNWQGAYFVVRSPEDAERQLNLWLLTLVGWKK